MRDFSFFRRQHHIGAIRFYFLNDQRAYFFAHVQGYFIVGAEMDAAVKAGFCQIFGSLLEIRFICREKIRTYFC